jgi:hypothetical protein
MLTISSQNIGELDPAGKHFGTPCGMRNDSNSIVTVRADALTLLSKTGWGNIVIALMANIGRSIYHFTNQRNEVVSGKQASLLRQRQY